MTPTWNLLLLVTISTSLLACDDPKPPPISSGKVHPTPTSAMTKASASAASRAPSPKPAAQPLAEGAGAGAGAGKVIAFHGNHVSWVAKSNANCTEDVKFCTAAMNGRVMRVPKTAGVPKKSQMGSSKWLRWASAKTACSKPCADFSTTCNVAGSIARFKKVEEDS